MRDQKEGECQDGRAHPQRGACSSSQVGGVGFHAARHNLGTRARTRRRQVKMHHNHHLGTE